MRLRSRLALALALLASVAVALAFVVTLTAFRHAQERQLDLALLVRAQHRADLIARLGEHALHLDVAPAHVSIFEGGIAALIMGFDGIAVDHYVRDDGAIDVDTIGMEYSVILKMIKNAAEMLDIGAAQEVAIRAERMTTLIRLVTEEYFLAVAVRPSGNFGKARYLMRVRAGELASGLA